MIAQVLNAVAIDYHVPPHEFLRLDPAEAALLVAVKLKVKDMTP